MKSYYSISGESLGRDAKIRICKAGASEEAFSLLAQEMCREIREHNEKGERTVLICPVGPVGQYPYFVQTVNREGISLKNCWFINMDEYMRDGRMLPMTDPLSFRGFMQREVYGKIRPELLMCEGQRVFPDPEELRRVPELIGELGGVDLALGGIGLNGHLAFNEPQPRMGVEEFSNLKTRVVDIAPETRAANCISDLGGALEDMPTQAVTVGMWEILQAKKIRLGVFRDWHRAVCRRAAYGEVSAAFPVTIAQRHSDIIIYVNEVAAEAAVSL